MFESDYVNGYIQKTKNGTFEGFLRIEGIDISPIEGVYFEKEGNKYLWLKRKRVLEYDDKTMTYKERNARPMWEVYIKKSIGGNTVAYKGEFSFMRFCYSIIGVWDSVLGKDKFRLNLFVERLPMSKQKIINSINERMRNEEQGRNT